MNNSFLVNMDTPHIRRLHFRSTWHKLNDYTYAEA